MSLRERDQFVKQFVKEIRENNAAVFVGAGLSMEAGFVDWKGLIRPIAEELGLDVDKEYDLVSIAQYHCNDNQGNRSVVNDIILNQFSKNATGTENHEILARLPIDTYWTTNYDQVLEQTLKRLGRNPDVKYTVPQLARTKARRDCIVYKMHGDCEHPDSAVLTKDDYESYHIKKAPFLRALGGDLVGKTFVFLGFSFSDPNIDYILSRVRVLYGENQRRHYCVMKKVEKESEESEESFLYRSRKQEFFINDLKRFSIRVVLLSDYSEIVQVLRDVERIYKRHSVFISGSAYEYGDWNGGDGSSFIEKMSQALIEKDFRIISGFGLGVGSSVINGALDSIYSMNQSGGGEQDKLILRPFPQTKSTSSNTDLGEQWRKYRESMISYAGIGIFVYGNKKEGRRKVNAKGVEEEFDICIDQGVFPIAVGVTGSVSHSLWLNVVSDIESYISSDRKGKAFEKDLQTIKSLYKDLGDADLSMEDMVARVLLLIEKMSRI